MKSLVASRTAPHRDPMDLDTSSTIDRSTIRRVDCAALATVTCSKFPTRMNDVGMIAEADTSTMFLPFTASVVTVTDGPLMEDTPM